VFSVSSNKEVRNLLSRASGDAQTLHSHAITGTPCEVPVPKNVIFTILLLSDSFFTIFDKINKKMTAKLYLIPTLLGNQQPDSVIPLKTLEITKTLRYFIVEELRTARRYLRLIDKNFPIDECNFFVLNEHTSDSEFEEFLNPIEKGFDIGLMSEAGLPCIADPGSKIVLLAHKKRYSVATLAGSSSIILALVASGLNGQNFTFNGYLPVKPAERFEMIKKLEKKSLNGAAQFFMETPYRNNQTLEAILTACSNNTYLCVAADISLPTESISTKKISEWKKQTINLKDRLVVFGLQGC
jgi:16S rRNA (cytidine1402-2'-O)-methyltransferase